MNTSALPEHIKCTYLFIHLHPYSYFKLISRIKYINAHQQFSCWNFFYCNLVGSSLSYNRFFRNSCLCTVFPGFLHVYLSISWSLKKKISPNIKFLTHTFFSWVPRNCFSIFALLCILFFGSLQPVNFLTIISNYKSLDLFFLKTLRILFFIFKD